MCDGYSVAKWAAVCLILLAAGVPAAAETRIEREFALQPGGSFVLDAVTGRVDVTGTAAPGARVVVTSPDDDFASKYDVRFVDGGNRVEVVVERKGPKARSWFNWGSGDKVTFDVEVPRRTNLDVSTAGGGIEIAGIDGAVLADTSGGSVTVGDVRGNVAADTSGGSIAIRDVAGDVIADTSGGGITVERVDGKVRADTSGGGIEMNGVTGDIDADTSGGPIRIDGAGGRVAADTSGGSVAVGFAAGNARGGTLSTSGGGVTATIDPAVGLEIDAQTSGGSVRSEVPLTVKGEVSRGSIRGTLNAGGALLTLRSSGGSIRIEPR